MRYSKISNIFLFEIKRYLKTKYKRYISVLFGILFISVYSLIVIESFVLNYSSKLNFHTYVIGELNITQFVMFTAFPFLFSILVSDLILEDFNSRYINFILPRAQSKCTYIISKFLMVVFISILFTTFILLCKLLLSIIFGVSLHGELLIYISTSLEDCTIFEIYMYTIAYFVSGLILIGMLSIVLSISIKNSGIPVGIVTLIGFTHNIFYIMESKYLNLLPYSQYVLNLQDNFQIFNFNIASYSLVFSFSYMWSLIGLLLLLIFYKIKNYDIRRTI